MEQVYCVMDMPLSVIKRWLHEQQSTHSSLPRPMITPLATDCLKQVANQPMEIQQAVMEGELPLYRFCQNAVLFN